MITHNASLSFAVNREWQQRIGWDERLKGARIKNGTLSIKAGFLLSLCVITCTRQLCAWAYLVYTACLAA